MSSTTTIELIAGLLADAGAAYTGVNANKVAEEWADEAPDDVDPFEWVRSWVRTRCWDPGTASTLAAMLTPEQARAACDRMIERDGAERYTDGDPMYAACNGDLACDEIAQASDDLLRAIV